MFSPENNLKFDSTQIIYYLITRGRFVTTALRLKKIREDPMHPPRRKFLKQLAAGLTSACLLKYLSCRTIKAKPNILLIMCDDLGYRDLSCFGNTRVSTPNIDRLAVDGFKLTQYYSASAVCTPTRASVLTGKYPLRFNIRKHFTDMGEFLPLCNTVPKLLKSAGYVTAHVGKWHLGGVREIDCTQRDKVPGPHQHGFDHYLTQLEQQPLRGRMGRERVLYRQGGTCLLRNDRVVGPESRFYSEFFTDINGSETVDLIEKFHKTSQPFFINLWFLVPHTPYEPAPEPHWQRTAEKDISDDQHRFRSMVARMDYQVGRILDTLEKLAIAGDTLILFTSDNGGAWEANIGDLKGGKTDLHEGGIRVPFLVRWPGNIKAGSASNGLCHSNDILPTICAAAGVPLPGDDKFDGVDLLPFLTGSKIPQRGTVFWQIDLYRHLQRHYPKPEPYATEIARNGRWKMLAKNGEPVELYDIEADLLERHNVLTEYPEIVERLENELAEWLKEPRRRYGQAEQ